MGVSDSRVQWDIFLFRPPERALESRGATRAGAPSARIGEADRCIIACTVRT